MKNLGLQEYLKTLGDTNLLANVIDAILFETFTYISLVVAGKLYLWHEVSQLNKFCCLYFGPSPYCLVLCGGLCYIRPCYSG